jgi:ATP-binding cassette subfamily B multidrug efflux pump
MSTHHEEEALGKAYDGRLMRRLLRYLRPYRGRVIGALVLSTITSGLAIVPPYLFKLAVDSYLIPAIGGHINFPVAMTGLRWVTVIFFCSLALSFALQFFQVLMMQLVGQQAMYDLRMEIFGHLQRLPMRFFDRNPVGRLVTRVTTDVDTLNDLFASGVVAMIGDVLTLVFIIAVMLRMDWRLSLTAFAVLPFILVVTVLFRRSFRDANRRIRTAIARINAFLQEHISGMSVVQLFNRERRARRDFEAINRTHMLAFKDAIFAHALFYPAVEFLGIAAVVLLLWFGGLRVLAAEAGFTLGTIIAFIQYAMRFFRPIQDLSEKYTILQSAMASSERIFKLLDEPEAPEAAAPGRTLGRPRGEIELRDVWFSYNPQVTAASPEVAEDWVLRGVSFRAEPGQTLALVGHTGAGKTTITGLLQRFYEIQRGQILIDGLDIRELALADLRRHFGVVLQDPFLFTGTLETNVRLGSEHVSRDTVRRALEEVRLGEFLATLPQGLDSPVSERGATFSVGQRQLISFARALAHDPRFLILDEATSSVDTQTEMMIREALDRLLSGRTAIVIAHRLSTIQRADRILVMHKGRLREQGTHQELLAMRGIYHRLYQLQYKDQELVPPGAAAPPLVAPSSQPLPADD